MLSLHWSAPARLEVIVPEDTVPTRKTTRNTTAIYPHTFHVARRAGRNMDAVHRAADGNAAGFAVAVQHPRVAVGQRLGL